MLPFFSLERSSLFFSVSSTPVVIRFSWYNCVGGKDDDSRSSSRRLIPCVNEITCVILECDKKQEKTVTDWLEDRNRDYACL